MMSKLLCTLTFIFVTVSHKRVICGEETQCFQTKLRNSALKLLESFKKFSENIRAFFSLPLKKLDARRKMVENAFTKFIDEAFEEDNIIMAQRLNAKRDDLENVKPRVLAPELIVTHGYRVEIHTVRTTDGYYLTLHRIPPANKFSSSRRIALLHHGLLGCSDDWILLGPNKALPYLLSDVGYDVWLANARGNIYSRTHVSRRVDSKDFWSFTFHEIGHYDLAATIDYIRKVTDGSSQIDFVGYSMGATALLVLLSSMPQYNPVLKSAVFLAPLAYMYSARGPIRLLAEFTTNHRAEALSFLGEKEYMRTQKLPLKFLNKFCVSKEEALCSNSLLLLVNGGKKINNRTLKKYILEHVPAGGSTKTILHYCQLLKSGQFQMFDFGIEGNERKYGMRSPPTYRLNDVTIPVAVFSSAHDWVSTVPDVMSLMPNLPFGLVHNVIQEEEFSHTDFLWSEEAPSLVYSLVLQILNQFEPRRKYI